MVMNFRETSRLQATSKQPLKERGAVYLDAESNEEDLIHHSGSYAKNDEQYKAKKTVLWGLKGVLINLTQICSYRGKQGCSS